MKEKNYHVLEVCAFVFKEVPHECGCLFCEAPFDYMDLLCVSAASGVIMLAYVCACTICIYAFASLSCKVGTVRCMSALVLCVG